MLEYSIIGYKSIHWMKKKRIKMKYVRSYRTNIHFALKVTKNRRNMTLAAAERELVILKTLVESKSPNKGKK